MRNLTGPNREPLRQTENDAVNPFGSEHDSSSEAHNESDFHLNGSGSANSSQSSRFQDRSGTYAPSSLSNSEFDRYPNRADVTADGQLLAPNFRASSWTDDSRKPSLNSYNDGETDSTPFLTNTDFSPFGGYPASAFPLHMDEKEADDYLHNPDPIADAINDRTCQRPDKHGWGIIFALVFLFVGAIVVFILLPILAFTGVTIKSQVQTKGETLTSYSYNLATVLRSSSLIDDDTPSSAKTTTSYMGETWDLVFSDEFEVEGRTFYEGDDPIWTAVDLWYGATKDLEWYSPDAVTTANGSLILRMDAYQNHNLNYRSGMVQSWNKLCFTQGKIEFGVRLPGNGQVQGLWPGLWTLGNLARPGYLASSDGVWPYTYSSCDAGITPNQSSPDGISYLPGQRLSSCTCEGEDHPNRGTGRGAPEIDIIEGTVGQETGMENNGVASQSVQLAPMDIWYMVDYNFVVIHNFTITRLNSWIGGPLQQAVSGTTQLNPSWYENYTSGTDGEGGFITFAAEWLNDDDDGYITWYAGGKATHTVYAQALVANGNIGDRLIAKEPMSIIMNLGISQNWVYISWTELVFPATMQVDYIRLYQPSGSTNINCDPADYPTLDYINNHPKVYQNANYTQFSDAGYSWPKNSLMDSC